jgi:hypothetical protein
MTRRARYGLRTRRRYNEIAAGTYDPEGRGVSTSMSSQVDKLSPRNICATHSEFLVRTILLPEAPPPCGNSTTARLRRHPPRVSRRPALPDAT